MKAKKLLRGSELATEIKKRLHKRLNVGNLDEIHSLEPKGYVLLKELPAFEMIGHHYTVDVSMINF